MVSFQASEESDLITYPGQKLEAWNMFWKSIWEINDPIKAKKTWQNGCFKEHIKWI